MVKSHACMYMVGGCKTASRVGFSNFHKHVGFTYHVQIAPGDQSF